MSVQFSSSEAAHGLLPYDGAFTRSRAKKLGVTIEQEDNTTLPNTYLKAPAKVFGPLRAAYDKIKALSAENAELKLERKPFNHYISAYDSLHKADQDITDPKQRSIFGTAVTGLVSKLFGTKAEEAKAEEPQNNDLTSRFGLNTTNGKVKFLAAILLTGLAVGYFTTRGSEEDCSKITDLSKKQSHVIEGLYSALNYSCEVMTDGKKCSNVQNSIIRACSQKPLFNDVLNIFLNRRNP